MKIKQNFSRSVLDWYEQQGRPFLEEHKASQLPVLDRHHQRIKMLLDQEQAEVPVCFLGAAAIGKSTLLNVLVSDRYNILPHGGVGPLTAQATVVRFAEVPYFSAIYFGHAAVNKMLFVLERDHERRNKLEAQVAAALQLDAESREEAERALPTEERPGQNDKLEAFQKQAQQMIRGSQHGQLDVPYLLDGLRVMLGQRKRWGTTLTPEDQARVDLLRERVEMARQQKKHFVKHDPAGKMKPFLDELREHATGALAPLIQNLEVGWNAECLKGGLVLVDLPGVGVANDEYRNVTTNWIRDKARALVMVVDRAGITEASVDTLRTTGFINRLLLSTDDSTSDPVSLAVAVVKLDQSASSDRQDDLAHNGEDARPWRVHFAETRHKAGELVRDQMQKVIVQMEGETASSTRDAKLDVLSGLVRDMQVHAISSTEYRLFHLDQDEDRPKVKSADETGIPAMRSALQALAAEHRARITSTTQASAQLFREQLIAALGLLRTQWEADARAAQEAEALRGELDAFLAQKQRELDHRQGSFREFLRNGVKSSIELHVERAGRESAGEIKRYLSTFNDLHWATLSATVRRGGAYARSNGQHLDLPNELALRFEEPIAVVWSKHILATLRKRTAELGQDYVALVGDVVAWAREREARVQSRFVEALHQSLAADTKALATIGKEAVDDLKSRVKTELYKKLVLRIRKTCEHFVESKKNEGPGVKERILSMFHKELAEQVMAEATPIVLDLLLKNYHDVETEISTRLAEYRNPLELAKEALVQSHHDSVRRSDAQRRKAVLERMDSLGKTLPEHAA